jgi:dihydrofolate reductase
MRKIILNVAVSLDGYIEGPNGKYDWCFTDQDYGFTDFMNRIDTIFYRRMQVKWRNHIINQQTGRKIMSSQEYLILLKVPLIKDNVEEEVKKIKQQPGKDIHLFGGASLVTTFVNADLIDECQLAVHPIILCAGKPLFMDIKERKKLRLVDSKAYQTGLVMLSYIPEINSGR